MNLSEEFETGGAPVHCSVQAAVRRLNARKTGDGRALVDAIENEDIRLTHIMDVMRRRGIELSESALRRHRKGRCGSCSVGKDDDESGR